MTTTTELRELTVDVGGWRVEAYAVPLPSGATLVAVQLPGGDKRWHTFGPDGYLSTNYVREKLDRQAAMSREELDAVTKCIAAALDRTAIHLGENGLEEWHA